MTFAELNLMPPLLRAAEELGYAEPSPIQAQAIPPVLAGRDLIGCAQTGTGKTAAFAMPILQHLAQSPAPRGTRSVRALVLTPTRELALQIKQSFDDYGCYLKVRNTVIFGGVGQTPQVEALRAGVEVLVATPGRLNDLCGQGHVDLSRVEWFVLDEADRMLDMGFIHDVKKVLARLPDKSRRQTLLFSATMPREIEALARQMLRDPVRVAVTPVSSTVDAIRQSVYKVDKPNKRYLLAWFLKNNPGYESVLVFTRTKHGADRVVKDLAREGVEAMAIHGNKSQNARQTALSRFKAGEIRVLVATDIAARGIDISGLACVVNYELPNVPETYVHRIGRTGRAGRDGVAVSFCNFDELAYLKDIEKLIGKTVPEVPGHPWPMLILEPTPRAERPPRAGQPQPAREQPPKRKQPAPQQSLREQPSRPAKPAAKPAKPAPRPDWAAQPRSDEARARALDDALARVLATPERPRRPRPDKPTGQGGNAHRRARRYNRQG
ncbi:MAG: DEAD/DEAH box helicase [Gemmiger sp.]